MGTKFIPAIVLSATVAAFGLAGCSGNQPTQPPKQSSSDIAKAELGRRGFSVLQTITSNDTITTVWVGIGDTPCRWRAEVYTKGIRSGQVYVFYTDPKTGADRVTIDPPYASALKDIPGLAACWTAPTSLPTT